MPFNTNKGDWENQLDEIWEEYQNSFYKDKMSFAEYAKFAYLVDLESQVSTIIGYLEEKFGNIED